MKRRFAGRHGFTLIEIMIALVILTLVVLGMATSTGRFMRVVAESDLQVAAIQLADDRIQTVLMDPNFAGLDTAYAGTESSFPTLPGFARSTVITLVGGSGQPTYHKRIVVTVTGPGLPQAVKRSATVAAP
jgi:prepilin-type N-terminal cleavage/methylation domain-containing protein